MTKSKHTPGPWKLSETHSNCVDDLRGNPIVLDVSEANARLIAAAPELLEALKEVVAETDDAVWLTKFNAIITKAEGNNE